MGQTRIGLSDFLCRIALDNCGPDYVRKKRLSRRWVVPGSSLFVIGSMVFQTAALVGHARYDRPDALGALIGMNPPAGKTAGIVFLDMADDIANAMRREPTRVYEVWQLAGFPNVDFSDVRTLEVMAKNEISLGDLQQRAVTATAMGVCYGMISAQAFEELWTATYETPVDQAEWNEWRRRGLALSETQQLYPLAQAEDDALTQVAAYVRLNRPELLDALALQGFA